MNIADEIIEMIRNGDVDDQIADIYNAVQMRRAIIGGQERAEEANSKTRYMEKGQRVRFNSGVRPKYMEGATATVAKYSAYGIKTVQLLLDEKNGRFDGTIRAHKSTLDEI